MDTTWCSSSGSYFYRARGQLGAFRSNSFLHLERIPDHSSVVTRDGRYENNQPAGVLYTTHLANLASVFLRAIACSLLALDWQVAPAILARFPISGRKLDTDYFRLSPLVGEHFVEHID